MAQYSITQWKRGVWTRGIQREKRRPLEHWSSFTCLNCLRFRSGRKRELSHTFCKRALSNATGRHFCEADISLLKEKTFPPTQRKLSSIFHSLQEHVIAISLLGFIQIHAFNQFQNRPSLNRTDCCACLYSQENADQGSLIYSLIKACRRAAIKSLKTTSHIKQIKKNTNMNDST